MRKKFFKKQVKSKDDEVQSLKIKGRNLNLKNQSLNDQINLKNNEIQDFKTKVNDLSFKNEFVARLLSSGQKNEILQKFHNLLYNDFMNFANKDDSLANEAQAFSMLQDIEKELEFISIYPELYSKAIIAVGGGFSSGKSAFISSFIDDDNIMLPISVKPTTAISTFVISDPKIKLNAFSKEGASVNLSELDPQIHSKISHDFIKGFGFKLKKIMPFMVLQAPLVKNCEHLCFIDTPGYNAAQDEFTNDDKQSASEFVQNSTALLWLVSVENGTIQDDDLAFLNELDLSDKRLFIVLNKADLRSKEQRKEIIFHIKEMLDLYSINYEGISTYSTKKKQEFEFFKISLQNFLSSVHTANTLHKSLITRLFEVYVMYEKAILTKDAQRDTIYKDLHSLSIDLTAAGFDENASSKEKIMQIQNKFAPDPIVNVLRQELKNAITKMQNAIDELFGKSLNIPLPNISIDDQKTSKAKDKTKLNAMILQSCKKMKNTMIDGEEPDIDKIAQELEYIANECGVCVEEIDEIFSETLENILTQEIRSIKWYDPSTRMNGVNNDTP